MLRQRLKTITYKPPRIGLRAVLCLLLGAAILGVSWQVQRQLGITKPFSLAPGNGAQQRDTSRKSRELALSAHTLYALLLGAFTQEGAARIGAAIKHCQLTAFFGLLAFAEYNGG